MADMEEFLSAWSPRAPSAETDRSIRAMIAQPASASSPAGRAEAAKCAQRTSPDGIRAATPGRRGAGILDAVVLTGAAALLVVAVAKYLSSSPGLLGKGNTPAAPKITPAGESGQAVETKPDDGFTDAERSRIAKLLDALSSESFEARQKASDELAADDRVLPLLEPLFKSSDAEVAARAHVISDAIRAKLDNVLLEDGTAVAMTIGSEDYVRVSGRSKGRDISIPAYRVKQIRRAHEGEQYSLALQKFSLGNSALAAYFFASAADELKKTNAPWAAEYCSYYLARCSYDSGRFLGYTGKSGTKYLPPSQPISNLLQSSPRSRFVPECVAMQPRCLLGENKLDAAKAAIDDGLARMKQYRDDTEHLPEYAKIADQTEARLKDLLADIQELQLLKPGGDANELRFNLHTSHYLTGNANEQTRSAKILREEYAGQTLNYLTTVVDDSKDAGIVIRAKALIAIIKSGPHEEIRVQHGLIEGNEK